MDAEPAGSPLLVGFALGLAAGAVAWAHAQARARARVSRLKQEISRLESAEARERQANAELGNWVASAIQEMRALSERVVRIQETERGRMARDLHDSVGQALTALMVDLQLLQRELHADDDQILLNRALSACQDAMADLRRVVYDLRPPELVEGVAVAEVLRSYAERFELREGIPTFFRATGGPIHSLETATCLLRVLQEALTNVSRHALAREVGIHLESTPREVVLHVSDDGQGFDPGARGGGTGLRGIEERCLFLGGTVTLDARPSEGTRLTIRLPVTDGRA